MLALPLALAASVAWGAADFVAGVGCRRVAMLTVLLVSQAIGFVLLVPVVLSAGGPPPESSFVLLGLLAGLFNALALAALYRGLAGGIMAIVAPVAATDAVIPVLFGMLSGERLGPIETLGIVLAFAGVVLAAAPAAGEASIGLARDSNRRSVALGLAAALCFGSFVVCLDGASHGGALWAVTYSRIASVGLLAAAALVLRPSFSLGRADAAPLLAIGVLDVGASALFAVATTLGMLSIVGILGSLYPVVTILLAAVLLRERPAPLQRTGAAGALVGAVMIAGG